MTKKDVIDINLSQYLTASPGGFISGDAPENNNDEIKKLIGKTIVGAEYVWGGEYGYSVIIFTFSDESAVKIEAEGVAGSVLCDSTDFVIDWEIL